MLILRILPAVAVAALLVSACASEMHDEPPRVATVTTAAPGDAFTVAAQGAVDVQISVGAPAATRIECDPDLLSSLHVEERAGVLRIWTDMGFGGIDNGPCTVHAGVASLHRLEASGSGGVRVQGHATDLAEVSVSGSGGVSIEEMGAPDARIEISGSGDAAVARVSATSLALELSGSGDVRLAGASDKVEIAVSGSGDIDARGLVAGDAAVTVTGSGDVALSASRRVAVTVQGSGDVLVVGRPAERNVLQQGSGSVRFE